MNLLTDSLPTKILIKNKVFHINCDYRTVIKIILAFEDEELTPNEKSYIMLKLLYKEDIPDDYLEEAIKKAIKFIDLGQEIKETEPVQRVFSYKKDGNYIFSGINQTHHIDLESMPNLHWWKFMALFMDMGTECTFNELIYYRKRKIEGKLTKEEKKKYREIKDLVSLEETKKINTAKQKFLDELRGGDNGQL